MKNKENLAVGYSFFRFPTHFVIVLLPFAIALSIFYFSESLLNIGPDQDLFESIVEYRLSIIDSFLQNYKIITAIIVSFFLTYRWSVIEKDGKYGFWLTQGTKRHKFFLLTFVLFYVEITIGGIAGVFLLFLPGGVMFSLADFIALCVLLIFSNFFVISFAILVAETIKNSEFALLLYVTVFAGQALLIDQLPDPLLHIFFTEQAYQASDLITPILFSLLASVLSFAIAYLIHLKKDVEL